MFFKKVKNRNICIEHSIQSVTELGDGMFSKKKAGDGFFYESEEDTLTIRAFETCKVNMIFPTKHAIGLNMRGVEIILHYGIDTVSESGAGIECPLQEGQTVNKGDILLVIDQTYYRERQYQVPVIYLFPNLEALKYGLYLIDEQEGKVEIR